MGDGNGNCFVYIAAGVVGIGILLTVILVPLSFKGLEYYEYGFKRQKSTGKVYTDEVYGGGKHFIGPDYEFKTFQSTAHFVDLSPVSVFTYEKLEIDIDIFFQYFLRKEDLPILHEKYDINYDYIMRKSAIAALKSEAPKFQTWQYITDRVKVEAALFRVVRERLGGLCCQKDCTAWTYACPKNCIPLKRCNREKEKGLWVDVKFFQLGEVQIDKDVEERYLRTLTLSEEADREKLKQEAQVVRKVTNANVLDIQNKAKEIRQTAEAESQLIRTVSRANYTVTVEKSRTEGLKSLYSRLQINDQSIKNSFDYLRTLRGLDHVHFTVDFQQRIVGGV